MKSVCPNRDSRCKSCGKKDKYVIIVEHEKTCEDIPCENAECGEIIHRQDLKHHLETCDHTEVQCKYQRIGCNTKLKRKCIAIHEDSEDKEHLRLALDKIITMDKTVEVMRREINARKGKIVLQSGDNFTFHVKVIGTSMVPSIYVDGYHMALSVTVTGAEGGTSFEEASVSLTLLKGEFDDTLDWPLNGSVTIALSNTLNNMTHIEHKKDIHGRV